jgi:hypothetical protein
MANRFFVGVVYNVFDDSSVENILQNESTFVPITCSFYDSVSDTVPHNNIGKALDEPTLNVIRKMKQGEKISQHERSILYNHSSVKLSLERDNLKPQGELKGLPIHVEHNSTRSVGKVLDSWVSNADGSNGIPPQLMVFGEVWDTNTKKEIDSGELRGLSIGYDFTYFGAPSNVTGKNQIHVDSKKIKEVSLCKEPFYKGCKIDITASKKTPVPQQTRTTTPINTPQPQNKRPFSPGNLNNIKNMNL